MATKASSKNKMLTKEGISVTAVKGLNLADAGSAEVLPIDELNVDPEYQRDLRHDLVDKIRREWDIVKAGPILVSQRKDGSLWCVDGQHRMTGAKLAGEEEIFAHVVHGLTQEQEAALRLARNERRSDNTFEKFRTRLVMGDRKAHSIVNICHQFGTYVNEQQNVHAGINAIATLESIYDLDNGEMLMRVLQVIKEAWGEDALHGRNVGAPMMKSIVWFLDRHVDRHEAKYAEFIERLQSTDISDIDRKARTHKAALGSSLWLNYYRALVEIWNFRRTDAKKLEWRSSGSAKTLGNDYSKSSNFKDKK